MALTILIINEHDSFCSFLSGFLNSDGHSTFCSKNDGEAVKIARLRRPDLIILEASRPEVAVLDIVQRLKRVEETSQIPIIVISDCVELEYELLQAFDFLLKPIDMNRLREDIELLGRGRKKARQIKPEPFSDSDYSNFSSFLVTHSGLHFERRNLKALERGVTSRMNALCIGTYGEYFEFLQKNQESRQELQKLLHFLTVGETFFFRYHAHFDALRQLLARDPGDADRPIRFWSAGCSTGEEAYSLAITVMEALPDWQKRDIRILATDINHRSLKRAQEGVYGRWAMRVMEEKYRERYFDQVGESYILHNEVKKLVHFEHLNLQTGTYPFEEGDFQNFDAIFCRNVMIYFTHATTKKIVGKMASSLRPGGYLFLGHSETLAYTSTLFERQVFEGGFYYRKKFPMGSSGPAPAPKPARPATVVEEPERPAPRPHAPGATRTAPPPPPPPEEFDEDGAYLQALSLFDAENHGEAAVLVEKLLQRNPTHVQALLLKGFLLANRGLFDEAMAVCSTLQAVNDLLPEIYYLKGLIRDMAEDNSDAADEYRKAILLKMDFFMPHYQLGRLYIRQNRMKEGVRQLRNCLRLLEREGEEKIVPFSGGMSREALLGLLRSELERIA